VTQGRTFQRGIVASSNDHNGIRSVQHKSKSYPSYKASADDMPSHNADQWSYLLELVTTRAAALTAETKPTDHSKNHH